MSTGVVALLETFDALSDVERREAAVENMLPLTPANGELPEGVLLEAADALFLVLDLEEAANAGP
jgi:hypothetical protein